MKLTAVLISIAQCALARNEENRPSSLTAGECKAYCKDVRQDILADINACKPALKATPVPKVFQTCVEGRKKAFDQMCVPMCSSPEGTLRKDVSSFEGCKSVVKKGQGPRFVDWCRRGFDDVFGSIESLFVGDSEEITKYQQHDANDVVVQVAVDNSVQELESEMEFTEMNSGDFAEETGVEVVPENPSFVNELSTDTDGKEQSSSSHHVMDQNSDTRDDVQPEISDETTMEHGQLRYAEDRTHTLRPAQEF